MNHNCTRHDTSATCYQKCQCRCEDCSRAQSRYAKQRRVRLAQGINTLVDATPAREHVQKLMSVGMSHGTIALAAGMPNSGLQALLGIKTNAKQVRRMHRRTVARILKVTYKPMVGVTFAPATGTRRRLQDLALRGFSAAEVSALSGIQKHTLVEVRCGNRSLVHTNTENAISTTHKHLEGTTPSITAPTNQKGLITSAKKAGFAPLAAFDDINDDKERPKGVAA